MRLSTISFGFSVGVRWKSLRLTLQDTSNPLAPRRITVPEIARRLGVGRLTVYELLRRGIIPGIRLGRRWIVTRHAYEGWERTCGVMSGSQVSVSCVGGVQ